VKRAAIIQARMGSVRLPGKTLTDLAGRPLLWHVVDRLRRCRELDGIVVATSTGAEDDPIEAFCKSIHIPCFRGDRQDVQKRYIDAAREYDARVVVRVTGDAPLICPKTIDRLCRALARGNGEYAIGHPDKPCVHEGFEAVTLEALERSRAMSNKPHHREHVTIHIRENLDLFRAIFIEIEPKFRRRGPRLSVDNPADLEFMRTIYNRLYRPPEIINLEEVMDLLDAHPEIAQINAHVEQKSVTAKSRKVAFRFEAGNATGMGHMIRCMTLARVLNENHHCGIRFVTRSRPEILESLNALGFPVIRIPGEGDRHEEIDRMTEILRWEKIDILVTDLKHGYTLPEAVRLKRGGTRLVVLDNDTDGRLVADEAIYPVAHLSREFATDPDWTAYGARCVHGPEYVVLRPEILSHRNGQRPCSRRGRKILVTCGGGDEMGISLKIVRALGRLKQDVGITVVAGRAFDKTDELDARVAGANGRFKVVRDPKDMSRIMASSGLAICTFGITAYELAFLGVPAIILSHSEHNHEAAELFAQMNTAEYLGYHRDVSEAKILSRVKRLLGDTTRKRKMAAAGRSLVDGEGAMRVSRLILGE